MKLKVKVDADSGVTYLAAIDPSTGEHRKSATLTKGQEVEVTLPTVEDESGIEFGEVVASDVEEPAEPGTDEPDGPEEPPAPEPDTPDDGDGFPAGLAIGRIVIYRSKTGKYDLPAIVNATTATLDPEGVELGHVPQLDGPVNVHLTAFTCGKEGTSREGEVVNNEAAGGSYQEFNIPQFVSTGADGEEIPAGTWRFPERV